MSYRARLLVAVAGAVGAAVALVSVGGYVVARAHLRSGVDNALRSQVEQFDVERLHDNAEVRRLLRPRWSSASIALQVVSESGGVRRFFVGQPALPVGEGVLDVARGERGRFLYDAHLDGVHVRVLVEPASHDQAIQMVRPLTETDNALRGLATVGGVVGGLGVLAALLAGLVLAQALLRPVRRLTVAAEDVARTQKLAAEIPVRGSDELARLARTFNAMLKALSASRQAQRQLVADASHELRTPLTILRSNLETLADDPDFRAGDQRALLGELAEQAADLGRLVNDLVELARDGIGRDERVRVRLDLEVDAAVAQARRAWPGMALEAALEPTELDGSPEKLQRAIRNLIDNARKWGPPEGPIEVTLREGRLRVRDHGPGIAPDDLPRIFDRFYRSTSARAQPGSGLGLGLAIVRQVAEAHGGSAYVEAAEGGGARFVIDLAAVSSPPAPTGAPP